MKKVCVLFIAFFMWSGALHAEDLSKEAKTLMYKATSVRALLPDSVCKKPITSQNKSSALRVQKDLKWEGAPKLAEFLNAVPQKERENAKVKNPSNAPKPFLRV